MLTDLDRRLAGALALHDALSKDALAKLEERAAAEQKAFSRLVVAEAGDKRDVVLSILRALHAGFPATDEDALDRHEDRLAVRLAVKVGIIDEAAARTALAGQDMLREKGQSKRLGEILVELGKLDAPRADRLYRQLENAVLICHDCFSANPRTGVAPGAELECPQCGAKATAPPLVERAPDAPSPVPVHTTPAPGTGSRPAMRVAPVPPPLAGTSAPAASKTPSATVSAAKPTPSSRPPIAVLSAAAATPSGRIVTVKGASSGRHRALAGGLPPTESEAMLASAEIVAKESQLDPAGAKAAEAAPKRLVPQKRRGRKELAAAGSRGPGQAGPASRVPLVVGGVVLALAAIGGAVYVAASTGTGPGPESAGPTQTQASTAKVAPERPTPAVASVTPLDRARGIVRDAEALESGKREGEAATALETALYDPWPTEAKRVLDDARTGVLERFRAKIKDAQALVASDDVKRARSALADLKRRCPDSLAPALIEVEKELEQAVARNERSDEPEAPRTDTPAGPTPREPRPRRDAPDPSGDERGGAARRPRPDPKPKDDPAPRADDSAKGDRVLAQKVNKVWTLLDEATYRGETDKAKVADAAKLVSELESLAPTSPYTRGARGRVLFIQRKYEECQADLAAFLEVDPSDDRARSDLASAYFLYGHFDEARALAKDQKDPDLVRLLYLIDGPWATSHPLAHAALEGKTADGHYSIVTDLGLDLGVLDKFETELEKAAPEKRPALIERFRKAHVGLKESQRYFEAAYKAYCKVFKIKEEKLDKGKPGAGDPKKEDAKKDASTVAGDGSKAVKTPVNHGRVSRVYVFNEKSEFAAFSQKLGIGSTEHILGYFMPSSKILAFYREQSKETTLVTKELHNVLFHETFHQFLDLFIEDSPPWFNEGLAEYFGISQLEGNSLRYGMVPENRGGNGSRYLDLQTVIGPSYGQLYGGETPSLSALMKMDHRQFMVHGSANYAMAWGFCHYLASSKPGQKRIKTYFRGLRDGGSADEVFRKAFGDVDQQRLEADFRSHVGDMAYNRPPPDDDD